PWGRPGPGIVTGRRRACQSASGGTAITAASTAEHDVLADGDGVGGVEGGDGELEAVGGVVVGVDAHVDAADAGDDRDMGGAGRAGDAHRIEEGVEVEDVLAAGRVAVEIVDGVVAVEDAGVADGVVAGAGVDAVVALAAGHGVVAGAAVDRVVAGEAAQLVGGAVAGKRVVERVAGAGAGAGARQRAVLEVGAEGEGDGTAYAVGNVAAGLADAVAGAVDNVEVVTGAADQAVGAGAAVERVAAVVAGERVGAGIARQVVVEGVAGTGDGGTA